MIEHPLPSSIAGRLPPQAWFGVSAIFHYLGPAFAVLLFPVVGVIGVAFLRIASAALVFAPMTRPWHSLSRSKGRDRLLILAFGLVLAAMNCAFYLALDRLPLSLVSAIEFAGTIGVAFFGLRSRRNLLALALTCSGVRLLIDIRWSGDAMGLAWAFANGALFVLYILIGHRLAASGAARGIERLGAAMAIAFCCVLPFGLPAAWPALHDPVLILAGAGVGLCSSVIPYICDQLAMARLPRASFALLLALLPATATVIGAVVLGQIPSARDLAGIALVMAGIALHRPMPQPRAKPA
jgi:inner membrane transporter RhtA